MLLRFLVLLLMLSGSLLCISCKPAPIYQGYYTWGHEVRSFQPCNSARQYWVRSTPEIQKPLLDYYQANTSQPYEPIYIEFYGNFPDEPPEGFARDYDGLIVIDSVVKLAPSAPATCKKP